MNEWIVSVSGIRGIVGQCFPAHQITRMAGAFGTHLHQKHSAKVRVAIARDTRASGEMTRHAAVAGLLSTGCDVIDLGMCPTPTLLLAARTLNVAGSIMITASHNPAEWNGLEIAAERGTFLNASDREAILGFFDKEAIGYKPWNAQGTLEEWDGAIDQHIKHILASQYVDVEAVQQRKLRVAIDAVNGAGSVITPMLLRELGCEVFPLYCDPDGDFLRSPEPTPKSLGALCRSVRDNRADLGLAHDADADRLTLVDEKGNAISEEYTLALIADLALRQKNGPVVTTVSTSLMVDDIAEKHGATVKRTKVGVNHVVDEMLESQAVLGGEGTGGIIFPEIHLTSDGITATAAMVQLLVETGKPLSSLVSQIPRYYISKKGLPIPSGTDPDAVIRRALDEFADEQLDTTDGVKLLRENSWVSIRKSGTEPVIRVFGEARSAQQADAFCGEIAEHIQAWLCESAK